MNLFKSVFSDSPDSPNANTDSDPEPNPTWSLDGLFKTLATKSESMIQTHRRDFHELGSGLRKETSIMRQVASRAVMDLPASLEVGASVAQESLETVGQAIDDIGATIWNSTSHIISHGKYSFLPSSPDHSHESNSSSSNKRDTTPVYSRFDKQMRAIQSDLNSYCCEPDDKEEYVKWKAECSGIDDREDEIDTLIGENSVVRDIFNKIVPGTVVREVFWSRYFYRIHKLKLAEESRVLLVKRAQEEEELKWDFVDDDDNDNDAEEGYHPLSKEDSTVDNLAEFKNGNLEGIGSGKEKVENSKESSFAVDKSGGGGDSSESCKDSDFSVVSSQSLPPGEDDLGWDEIEDVGSNGEGKGEDTAAGGTPSASRVEDLHKRLTNTDEEEYLTWDIEDEDNLDVEYRR